MAHTTSPWIVKVILICFVFFWTKKIKNFHKAIQVVPHSLEIPNESVALKMPKLVNGAKEKICAVPEKIVTPPPPMEVHWKFLGGPGES